MVVDKPRPTLAGTSRTTPTSEMALAVTKPNLSHIRRPLASNRALPYLHNMVATSSFFLFLFSSPLTFLIFPLFDNCHILSWPFLLSVLVLLDDCQLDLRAPYPILELSCFLKYEICVFSCTNTPSPHCWAKFPMLFLWTERYCTTSIRAKLLGLRIQASCGIN